jgi:hypothetical protein
MQLSLRPYVTTGVALVGASVIAAAPMQPVLPADVQIPNPVAQVARDVHLTANEIETATNNIVLAGTQLGLRLTVPITAALIDAIAPDLVPPGLTPEAVATLLLLGLSGPLISGTGSVGTALQGVVDGFGDDFGTGLVALLVGAPSTIIQGFVLGGFGPDLTQTLLDAGFPVPPAIPIPLVPGGCAGGPGPTCLVRPVENVFAGGLINNPALTMLPGGLQLVSLLTPPSPIPTGFNIILPGAFPTAGQLLQGLLDAVDLNAPDTMLAKTAGTNNVATLTSDKKVEDPTQKGPIRELLGNVRDAVVPNSADGPEVLPKKNRPLLNILKLNPLDQSTNKDKKDNVSSLNSNDDTPSKHRIGTPVRDLVHKVLGGSHDNDDNDDDSGDSPDEAPAK